MNTFRQKWKMKMEFALRTNEYVYFIIPFWKESNTTVTFDARKNIIYSYLCSLLYHACYICNYLHKIGDIVVDNST